MITAGACRENIDPMRFISNCSTGKMGLALARAASIRGADVTLISAHISVNIPAYIKTIKVSSAAEMHKACLDAFDDNDIVIMNAAVSDYRPAEVSLNKIKKSANLSLELVRTKDIISELTDKRKQGHIICGFAAESENIMQFARDKMIKKNMDCIVANDLKVAGSDITKCTFIAPDVEADFSGDKFDVAHNIMNELLKI